MKFYGIAICGVLLLLTTFHVDAQQSAAQSIYDQSLNLLQNKRFDEALVMLNQATDKDPNFADAYFQKANCHIGMNKFNLAIKELEMAVKANPEYYEAYEILGNLYAQFRNAPKAIKNYEKAFEVDKSIDNKLKYKLQIIEILYTVKQHQRILEHIQDAKELGFDNFDLSFLEAKYYNYIGDYPTSKRILESIIKGVPVTEGNEMYFYELGYAYHKLEEYEKAEEVFKNANGGEFRVRLRQFTPAYYFEVAQIYFSVYEYELCEEYLNLVLKIEPGMTEAYDMKTRLAAIKTNKSQMIEFIEKGIEQAEKDGNSAEAGKYMELALLNYQNYNYTLALEACDNFLDKKPMDYDALFLKAACEYQLKEPGQATEMLERAVKNPKMPKEIKAKYNFLVGLVYKNSDDLDKAEHAFQLSNGGPFRGAAASELEVITKIKQKKSQAE